MTPSEIQSILFRYREAVSEKAWDWMKLCGAANTSGLLAIGVAISGVKDRRDLLHGLKYPGMCFLLGILFLTCAFMLFAGFYILDKQAEAAESLGRDGQASGSGMLARYRRWQLRNRLAFATLAIGCGAVSILCFAAGVLWSIPLFASL